ncbi:MAG: hypothetical protein BGN97_15910 [Microbacterium sp. 69-10]|nr:MAG: hypothetical protein BGN97_15910 [Microbacterium sp. 69-10]
MVVVFSGLFLHEGFPKPLIIGAPLAFLGVVLIGMTSHTDAGLDVTGLLLALLAAVMYAGCTLLQKHLLSAGADSTTLTFFGAAAGTVALLPWTGSMIHAVQTAPLDATYVVPAIAILLSWLILGEVPTPLMLLGGALCLLGVLVTRMGWRRRG